MAINIGAWELVRTVVALACFTLVPGYLVFTLAFSHEAFEKYLTVPISLGVGLAISVLVSYCTEWAAGSLTDYTYVMLAVNAIGTAVVVWRRFARKRIPESSTRIPRTTLLLILLVVTWFGVTLNNGPRIGYAHDTWQHVAHIRGALEQDILTPTNALRPDQELPSFVTRWHTVLAGIARSARVDALFLWYVGNAYVTACTIVVIFAFARMIWGRADFSLVAAVVFLATSKLMYTFVYPWGISYTLLWVILGLFLGYLRTGSKPGLSVAIIVGITMNFLHGMEFVFLCLGISAFVFVAGVDLLRKKQSRQTLVRSLVFLCLLMMFGLPFSLLNYSGRIGGQAARLETALDTSDVAQSLDLYQKPPAQLLYWAFPHQGTLLRFLIELLPFGAIALPLSLVTTGLAKHNERRLLITLTWAPILVYVLPGFSWVTQVVLDEVWAYRLVRLIPASLVLPSAIHWGRLDALVQKKPGFQLRRAIVSTVVAVAVGFTIADRLIGPEYQLDPWPLNRVSPLNNYKMFGALDSATIGPAVVLSDPWTSSTIPALTKHDVLLSEKVPIKQDLYAEMHNMLSYPFQSSSATIASLEKNHIDYVVINTSWIDEILPTYGTDFYSDYTLTFLDGNPKCFSLIFTDDVFRVYEYIGCSSSELMLKDQNQETPSSKSNMDTRIDHEFLDDLALAGYSVIGKESVKPGQQVQVDLYWDVIEDRAGIYAVWLELTCDYAGRERFYGKAIRSTMEIIGSRTYAADAFEWLVVPTSDSQGQSTFVQNFSLSVPPNMVTGMCDLSVYITAQRQEWHRKGILAFAVMEKDYLYRGVDLGQLQVNQQ